LKSPTKEDWERAKLYVEAPSAARQRDLTENSRLTEKLFLRIEYLQERIKELEASRHDMTRYPYRAHWERENLGLKERIKELKDLVDQLSTEDLDEERIEQARAAMTPGEESTLRDHQICRLQAQRDRLEQSQADSTNYSQEVIALRQRDRKQVERIKELEEENELQHSLQPGKIWHARTIWQADEAREYRLRCDELEAENDDLADQVAELEAENELHELRARTIAELHDTVKTALHRQSVVDGNTVAKLEAENKLQRELVSALQGELADVLDEVHLSDALRDVFEKGGV
jgi:hypothetical protein